ncbi:2-C-methyl-D-erythritol 2,4-cyclodiphosphate synthase [Buchnera aphidicola (Muscaphis stroyani)]|uniref:2-C-methyl-D-erythritol 2,4-cyclodiphosphate synthase n=1 Tax=Buchnera aphidicola (Muscaphis stroyani) TaxID=1241869 RepID=A0A4D6Y5G9_9GAMM|nr:2-C-methyl-D-erythritol 2,4-cyclodiphosphate synthase [Buchnera aphidicola]QCI24652.1 2-C-methyl-D-erythritol 2,4-cyclodiphosphate synthase [Buchnera aphidicola (Muscaphis stroyani)]
MRVGYGFDIHAFGGSKPLIIGGVLISKKKGLIAHSNGDLLIHALIDSLLGAAAMGDIGSFFPSKDKRYKNIDSKILLQNIWEKIKLKNYCICNIDITIIAEYPKMSSYIFSMKSNLSRYLKISIDNISIKATSSKMIGCIGRKEGIACHSSVLILKK